MSGYGLGNDRPADRPSSATRLDPPLIKRLLHSRPHTETDRERVRVRETARIDDGNDGAGGYTCRPQADYVTTSAGDDRDFGKRRLENAAGAPFAGAVRRAERTNPPASDCRRNWNYSHRRSPLVMSALTKPIWRLWKYEIKT